MNRYSGDPYWLTARFGGNCSRCQRPVKKGDRIFYYPKGKTVLCDGADCGQEASAEFTAAAQDEALCNGSCW